MRKVLIFDTSILCAWLAIPGKETCGPQNEQWDTKKVTKKIESEDASTTFVLPLAAIIETGNHIANAKKDRYKYAQELAQLIKKTANEESPWVAFSHQSDLWARDNLRTLADTWPQLAAKKLSLADATIKDIAAYYAKMGYDVEMFTGDSDLHGYQYQPQKTSRKPRRSNRL